MVRTPTGLALSIFKDGETESEGLLRVKLGRANSTLAPLGILTFPAELTDTMPGVGAIPDHCPVTPLATFQLGDPHVADSLDCPFTDMSLAAFLKALKPAPFSTFFLSHVLQILNINSCCKESVLHRAVLLSSPENDPIKTGSKKEFPGGRDLLKPGHSELWLKRNQEKQSSRDQKEETSAQQMTLDSCFCCWGGKPAEAA